MSRPAYVKLTCQPESFRTFETAGVRWLDWDADFELARRSWAMSALELTRDNWEESRQLGYRYCAFVEQGTILALAAEYRFSEAAWMLAAVSTPESHRLQGLATKVSAFVTASILEAGRLATCETAWNNLPMLKTAAKLGYVRQID
jgi:hypothetical protein